MPSVRGILAGTAVVVVALTGAVAHAQYQQNQSYSNYYREQYNTTRTVPRSAVNYTIDKHYYHNKNVSPYLNLVRPSSSVMPRYQTFVQPEVQRRKQMQPTARPVTPSYSRIPNYGGAAPKRTQYHDHWYGGMLSSP